MSAFNTIAAAGRENVSGIFGLVATDPSAVKAGVVLGITQSLGQSFGNDGPAFERKFGL